MTVTNYLAQLIKATAEDESHPGRAIALGNLADTLRDNPAVEEFLTRECATRLAGRKPTRHATVRVKAKGRAS